MFISSYIFMDIDIILVIVLSLLSALCLSGNCFLEITPC